jgi:hypothetical protein
MVLQVLQEKKVMTENLHIMNENGVAQDHIQN